MHWRIGTLALCLVLFAVACGGDDEPEPRTGAPGSDVTTAPADDSGAGDASGSAGDADAPVLAQIQTTDVVPDTQNPDASTFINHFDADTQTVYLLYRFDVGDSGSVDTSWSHEGTTVYEGGSTTPDDGTWVYEGYQAPSEGFDPGQYEIALTVTETGQTTLWQFEVSE